MEKKMVEFPSDQIKIGIDLLKVARAMDRAMSIFENDQSTIFSLNSDIKTYIHDQGYQKIKSPRDKVKCSFKNCENFAVHKSHTIQKSASLNRIAENGHVYGPAEGYFQGHDLQKCGINEASTFPGFCTVHEQKFSKFENQGALLDHQDYRLQTFRTICREITINKRLITQLNYRKHQYVNFRNNKLDEYLDVELKKENIDRSKLVGSRYDLKGKMVRFLEERIKLTTQYLKSLDLFYESAFFDMENQIDKKMAFIGLELDWEIPCCLAGRGGLKFQGKQRTRSVEFILNVLPYQKKTYLIVASFRNNKRHVMEYIERYNQNPFALITMVESWMMYGSDHWFISPTLYHEMSNQVKEKIYYEMYLSHKSIWAVPEFSIFKDTRKKLIEYYKGLGTEYEPIIKAQEMKMMEDEIK